MKLIAIGVGVCFAIFTFYSSVIFADEKDTRVERGDYFDEETGPKTDSTRVVFAPTARAREKGEWGLTIYDFVLADIEYGLLKHLEIGLGLAAPVAIIGLNPHARIWGELTPRITVALNLWGTFVFPYIESERDHHWAFGGGGPLITFGDKDSYLNLGFQITKSNTPLSTQFET